MVDIWAMVKSSFTIAQFLLKYLSFVDLFLVLLMTAYFSDVEDCTGIIYFG